MANQIKEAVDPPKSPYYELFHHMYEQHGLTLLESELQEIVSISKEILETKFDR